MCIRKKPFQNDAQKEQNCIKAKLRIIKAFLLAEQHIFSYPFRDLNVQHEEMHVFLSFVQRQRLGDNCDQHGRAGYTLKPTQKKHQKHCITMCRLTNRLIEMTSFKKIKRLDRDTTSMRHNSEETGLISGLNLLKSSAADRVLCVLSTPLPSRESTCSKNRMLIPIPHMVSSNKSKLYLHREFNGWTRASLWHCYSFLWE